MHLPKPVYGHSERMTAEWQPCIIHSIFLQDKDKQNWLTYSHSQRRCGFIILDVPLLDDSKASCIKQN